MTAATAAQAALVVSPFGIEADHPRNCDLLLQCIPNMRLRSVIVGSRPAIDRMGEFRTPLDQARHLASLPRLPGMQLHVNPAKCVYEVIDPLYEDEALCERIAKWMRENNAFRTSGKVKGIAPQKGELDVHRMKSLCREMLALIDAGEARLIRGPKPELDEIEQLPGKFLLNPGIRTSTTQPVFEEDFPEWVSRLSNSGG